MARIKDQLILFSCLLTAAILIQIFRYESTSSEQENRLLAPPPEYIEFMHFGFPQSIADSLWLRWIQDGDVCHYYFGEVPVVNDVIAPGLAKDLTYNPRHKKCDESWGFKMLDAITKIDPMFKMPYLAGTMALSVLVEDYDGATVIFNRGLSIYPDDWQLNYRAGYHFMFDKKDSVRAAELLTHAADTGGPVWLRSLAARLYSQVGQLELGISTLLAYRETMKENENAIAELDKRIAAMRAELEKSRIQK